MHGRRSAQRTQKRLIRNLTGMSKGGKSITAALKAKGAAPLPSHFDCRCLRIVEISAPPARKDRRSVSLSVCRSGGRGLQQAFDGRLKRCKGLRADDAHAVKFVRSAFRQDKGWSAADLQLGSFAGVLLDFAFVLV